MRQKAWQSHHSFLAELGAALSTRGVLENVLWSPARFLMVEMAKASRPAFLKIASDESFRTANLVSRGCRRFEALVAEAWLAWDETWWKCFLTIDHLLSLIWGAEQKSLTVHEFGRKHPVGFLRSLTAGKRYRSCWRLNAVLRGLCGPWLKLGFAKSERVWFRSRFRSDLTWRVGVQS